MEPTRAASWSLQHIQRKALRMCWSLPLDGTANARAFRKFAFSLMAAMGGKRTLASRSKTERRSADLSIGGCPLSGLNIAPDEALRQAHTRSNRDCHGKAADNGQRHGEEQQEPVCGTRTEMLAPAVRLTH